MKTLLLIITCALLTSCGTTVSIQKETKYGDLDVRFKLPEKKGYVK